MTTDQKTTQTPIPPPTEDGQPQLSYIIYIDATFAIADTWVTRVPKPRNRGSTPNPGELIFISMTAAQHAIKAIRPNMRLGRMKFGYIQPLTSESNPPDPRGAIDPNGLKGGSFYETRLPKVADSPITSHLIAIAKHPGLVTKKAGDHSYKATGVYVFTLSEEDLAKAFYRHFKEHSAIPTLPQWADQIWEFAGQAGLARKLPSSNNINAWYCQVDDYLLTPLISEAVAKGKLPIP